MVSLLLALVFIEPFYEMGLVVPGKPGGVAIVFGENAGFVVEIDAVDRKIYQAVILVRVGLGACRRFFLQQRPTKN